MLWWTLRQLKSKDFHTGEKAARKLGASNSPAAPKHLVTVPWSGYKFQK